MILGILLIIAGICSGLVIGLCKQETVCKIFLLEVQGEDYKKIRLFALIMAGILVVAGCIILIFNN